MMECRIDDGLLFLRLKMKNDENLSGIFSVTSPISSF